MMHLCYNSCTQLEREIKSFQSLIFWAASGFNPIRIKTSIERFLSLSQPDSEVNILSIFVN